MYDISNERESIEKSLKYYRALRSKIIDKLHDNISENFDYKVNKFLNNLFYKYDYTPIDYFNNVKTHWWFNTRVDNYNFYMVYVAITDLQTWLEAIKRNNHFLIDDSQYKDFLKYINK